MKKTNLLFSHNGSFFTNHKDIGVSFKKLVYITIFFLLFLFIIINCFLLEYNFCYLVAGASTVPLKETFGEILLRRNTSFFRNFFSPPLTPGLITRRPFEFAQPPRTTPLIHPNQPLESISIDMRRFYGYRSPMDDIPGVNFRPWFYGLISLGMRHFTSYFSTKSSTPTSSGSQISSSNSSSSRNPPPKMDDQEFSKLNLKYDPNFFKSLPVQNFVSSRNQQGLYIETKYPVVMEYFIGNKPHKVLVFLVFDKNGVTTQCLFRSFTSDSFHWVNGIKIFHQRLINRLMDESGKDQFLWDWEFGSITNFSIFEGNANYFFYQGTWNLDSFMQAYQICQDQAKIINDLITKPSADQGKAFNEFLKGNLDFFYVFF